MTWAAGDLALCVGHAAWTQVCGDFRPRHLPRRGGLYTVNLVIDEPVRGNLHTFLGFDDIIGGYEARAFRKIHPLTDEVHRQAREDLRVGEVVGCLPEQRFHSREALIRTALEGALDAADELVDLTSMFVTKRRRLLNFGGQSQHAVGRPCPNELPEIDLVRICDRHD